MQSVRKATHTKKRATLRPLRWHSTRPLSRRNLRHLRSLRFVRRNWLALAVIGLAAAGMADPAHAAQAGGGQMPWDTGLTNLKNDFTGLPAFAITLLAMATGFMGVIWHGEITEFTRRTSYMVFGGSALVFVAQVATALNITGAVV